MKKRVFKQALVASLLASSLVSTSAFAHHAALDIVDELIWLMIDEKVADTPHADLDFTTMGN